MLVIVALQFSVPKNKKIPYIYIYIYIYSLRRSKLSRNLDEKEEFMDVPVEKRNGKSILPRLTVGNE
jgi:hypothetical protein